MVPVCCRVLVWQVLVSHGYRWSAVLCCRHSAPCCALLLGGAVRLWLQAMDHCGGEVWVRLAGVALCRSPHPLPLHPRTHRCPCCVCPCPLAFVCQDHIYYSLSRLLNALGDAGTAAGFLSRLLSTGGSRLSPECVAPPFPAPPPHFSLPLLVVRARHLAITHHSWRSRAACLSDCCRYQRAILTEFFSAYRAFASKKAAGAGASAAGRLSLSAPPLRSHLSRPRCSPHDAFSSPWICCLRYLLACFLTCLLPHVCATCSPATWRGALFRGGALVDRRRDPVPVQTWSAHHPRRHGGHPGVGQRRPGASRGAHPGRPLASDRPAAGGGGGGGGWAARPGGRRGHVGGPTCRGRQAVASPGGQRPSRLGFNEQGGEVLVFLFWCWCWCWCWCVGVSVCRCLL
jgi:hypothetical protein